jgi:transcriptional regulator with XRE-family HTH domain
MSSKETNPFWERVKKLIKAHKTSQEQLSFYLGISLSTLKCWIQHNRIPDAYTACDMAEALGVSVEYLVKGTDGKAMEMREKDTLSRKTAAADIKKMTGSIMKNAGLIG